MVSEEKEHDSKEEQKEGHKPVEGSNICMSCSKEQGPRISLNQTNEEQDAFMSEFDRAKSSLKESKQKGVKDTLLKKRKRDDAGLDIGETKAKEIDPSKRQKTDDRSETFQSLFIKSSTEQSEMLKEGRYEGDFMTRCAKWGLQ